MPGDADGPWYWALPKPRIGKKINGSKSETNSETCALSEAFRQVDAKDDSK